VGRLGFIRESEGVLIQWKIMRFSCELRETIANYGLKLETLYTDNY
jgi:hypothetical protein